MASGLEGGLLQTIYRLSVLGTGLFCTERCQKREFAALRDLMDLLHEGGETAPYFDYDTGKFVVPLYIVPLKPNGYHWGKKSTKFPCYKNFPYVSAFIKKVTDDVQRNIFRSQGEGNLTDE